MTGGMFHVKHWRAERNKRYIQPSNIKRDIYKWKEHFPKALNGSWSSSESA